MPPVGFQLLTIPKAAASIGIKERIIRAALKEGTGPAITQIRKRLMIRSDMLAQWIERRTTTGTPPAITMAVPASAGLTLADALKSSAGQHQMAA